MRTLREAGIIFYEFGFGIKDWRCLICSCFVWENHLWEMRVGVARCKVGMGVILIWNGEIGECKLNGVKVSHSVVYTPHPLISCVTSYIKVFPSAIDKILFATLAHFEREAPNGFHPASPPVCF